MPWSALGCVRMKCVGACEVLRTGHRLSVSQCLTHWIYFYGGGGGGGGGDSFHFKTFEEAELFT